MDIELNDLMGQLQGHWQLDNGEQNFEINGNELTITSNAGTIKTTFELIRNIQLRNWQIKVVNLSWLRTFIVQITPEAFTIYDFNLKVNMTMGARSKLLNPTRIYNYTRVPVAAEI